jgi:hypothetical protein
VSEGPDRGQAMSGSDLDDKQRNREIARNEEKRKTIGAIRVSTWAIVFAIVVGAVAAGIVFAWLSR